MSIPSLFMRRQLRAMARVARSQGAGSIALHLDLLAAVHRVDPRKPARLAYLHANVTGRALRYAQAARGETDRLVMAAAFATGRA